MDFTQGIIDFFFNFLIWIVNYVLFIVYKLLSIITFIIPEQFTDALSFLFSLTNYAAGIFNIEAIFNALIIYINFLIVWYTYKAIMWGYAHLPWVGKGNTKLPTHKS